MFEKEAEEYATKLENVKYSTLEWWSKRNAFYEGAEFGYNKANEWHYVKDGDLPKDNSYVLVWTIDGGITTNYGEEYSDGIPENGLFQGIHISDVIAWKEIVLPELKESE